MKSGCTCPEEPDCDEGPNYDPIVIDTDSCGCNVYNGTCGMICFLVNILDIWQGMTSNFVP